MARGAELSVRSGKRTETTDEHGWTRIKTEKQFSAEEVSHE